MAIDEKHLHRRRNVPLFFRLRLGVNKYGLYMLRLIRIRR